MKTINISIDDALYASWHEYATNAGLPIESLITEATRFSINTDRLGVEQAKLQNLQNLTREAELIARLKKAKSSETTKNKQPSSEIMSTISNNLNDADLPNSNNNHAYDTSVNMADLEEATNRNI